MSFVKTDTAWDKPRSYVAYDLETTGFSEPRWPIQYGAVRVVDGVIREKFSTLAALPTGAAIERRAERKHGISEADLVGVPSQEEAYRAFSEFVGDFPLVSYNGKGYDDRIINRMADLLGMPHLTDNRGDGGQPEADACEMFKALTGDTRRHSLADACAYYGVTNERAHDAMSDVLATHEVYQSMLPDIARRSTDPRDISVTSSSDELVGEVVCVTGHDQRSKAQFERLAKGMGAQLHPRVTKAVTTCILIDDEDTGNSRKARQYGVRVVTGADFLSEHGLSELDLAAASGGLDGGVWESDMDEETRKALRRELDLPVTKGLVWAHTEDSWSEGKNAFGHTGPMFSCRYIAEPVADIRVHRRFDDGTVTLDVKMSDGTVRERPVNGAYFSTMQSAYKFMSSIGRDAE